MEVSNLLSHDVPSGNQMPPASANVQQTHNHSYPTRHSSTPAVLPEMGSLHTTPPPAHNGHLSSLPTPNLMSPQVNPTPKHVAFELLFPESPQYRARLPMRVQIFPHDTTESITTTVKNFYGLYEGPDGAKGVSFEDERGNTLIARYENFTNNMVVYVRVLVEPVNTPGLSDLQPRSSRSILNPVLGETHSHPAQALTYGQPPSRPGSRTAQRRSVSPHGRQADLGNLSHEEEKKHRSRSGLKSRGSSTHGSHPEPAGDAASGYSDSDGGHGSVTSSRKARSEQLASAEISLDNIVEGGRRKRAKFESSELPLFVPPQIPLAGSSSSVSPARRANGLTAQSAFPYLGQRTFAYPQPFPSPQTGMVSDTRFGRAAHIGSAYSTPVSQHGHHLRDRGGAPYPVSASVGATPHSAPGILPTPDPTVASCISDEDVALQLMRLGDTSNISNGTRHSASTLDDGFSGVADAASSTGATSESDCDTDGTERPSLPTGEIAEQVESSPIPLPGSLKRKHKHLDEILPSFDSTEPSGDEAVRAKDDAFDEDRKDGTFKEDPDETARDLTDESENLPKAKRAKTTSASATKPTGAMSLLKGVKVVKVRTGGSHKAKIKSEITGSKPPISTASLPAQSRKSSSASVINFQHQLGEDEEDLSSKPRCQRCRKSKKGCDRQRPCQRCKDAGIGIEGCVSEDENNGRKGRFGRHMGVIVKKDTGAIVQAGDASRSVSVDPAALPTLVGAAAVQDKSKKRKR